MPRVLVVERSATFRHALRQRLARGGVRDCDSIRPEDLAHTLSKAPLPDVVILGLPLRDESEEAHLLTLLAGLDHNRTAVVLLAEQARANWSSWIAQRPRSTLLSWDEVNNLVATIAMMRRSGEEGTTSQQHAGTRILLVDDSRTIRTRYSKLLREHGYEVETAHDVDSGFEASLFFKPDIVIIDYFMDPANGDVLCQRLREDARTRGITSCLLTGTYKDEIIHQALRAGAVECMFKNESMELFLARVHAMSRAAMQRRALERKQRHLSSILDAVGEGVFGVNKDGRISFINPAALRLLGQTESAVIGRSPSECFHHTDIDGKAITADTCFLSLACRHGEQLSDWQTVFRSADGQIIYVEGTIYPYFVDGLREGSVVAFRDVSEQRHMEEELRWKANHDPLTTLYNRAYFEQQLDQEVERCHRSPEVSALVSIDLDQFKYLNDTAGHAAGDQLLVQISQRLLQRVRGADTVARLGGDEFAVILRNIGAEQMFAAADSFRQMLAETHFSYDGKSYQVNGSVGVAAIDADTPDAADAMARSDLAAGLAKEKGRNQTHVYSAEDDRRGAMHQELGWSSRLIRALDSDEFELLYQPSFAVRDVLERGNQAPVQDCEVLVRLRDDQCQQVLPGAFLGAARRFGLSRQLDQWVIRHALVALADSDQRLRLSLNITGESVRDSSFPSWLRDQLRLAGINGQRLCLEIQESDASSDLDRTRSFIAEMSDIGCRCALDGFGSGMQAFNLLRNLAFSHIKLDDGLTRDLVDNLVSRELVQSAVRIMRQLGKRTVAGGVESQQTLQELGHCGVDQAQGFLLQRPAPLSELNLDSLQSEPRLDAG